MYRLLRLFLKVRARSRRCSSFPNRNRLRWVAIWVRRCAADLSRYGEISFLSAPSSKVLETLGFQGFFFSFCRRRSSEQNAKNRNITT